MHGRTTYLALLRGINVGGNKKISMSELREMVEALAHGDVRTYIQSGNILFTSTRTDADALAAEIVEAIAGRFSMQVSVVVRSADQLAEVIASNPFPDAEANPAAFHVAFLSEQPASDRLQGFDLAPFLPDELRCGDLVLYLRYANGAGRSKLTNNVLERRLGVRATSRNWNTVTKLLELARG